MSLLPYFPCHARCRHVAVLALFVGLATGQVWARSGDDLQLVCLNGNGGAHRVPTGEAAPEVPTWRGIDALIGPDVRIQACWVWTDQCPPVKRLSGSSLEPACHDSEAPSTVAPRSGLVVRLPNLDDDLAGSSPWVLTAAPSGMWREVPRSLLPVRAADAPVVRLPPVAGPWRVQACDERRCSRWTDVPEETSEVSLRLSPAEMVSYRIAADGAPLVDALFYLLRAGRGGLSQTEVLGFEQADADGRVEFQLPAEQRSAVVVSAQGRQAVAFATLRDVPDRLELGPGFFLSGRIVDRAGDPVAARLYGRSFIMDGFGLTQLQRGQAGADGFFRLTGFPAGPATLRAVAEADGELEFARRLDLGGSVDLGDLVLGDVEVVWVRVVDAQRRSPVKGALIRAADGRVTGTGTDGLSDVQVRYGRELQVTARGYGLALPRLPTDVGRVPDQPFLIELEPALTVTGVYLAADGVTPAANGRFSAKGADDLLLSGTVAAEGAFTIDLPGGGDWEIELSAGNAGAVRLEVTGRGGETIDLGIVRAQLSTVVSGYIVGDSYQPLVGAAVTSTPPSEVGPLLGPLLGGTLNTTSGADGHFELHGLEAGPAGLRIAAEGYAPYRLEINVGDGERIDLGTIELDRGREITVRSDAEGGSVKLTVGDALPPEEMAAAIESRAAAFQAVPEGPVGIVVFNEDGHPVCTRKAPESEGDLSVPCNDRSVRVTGRVTLDGVPVSGRLLWRSRRGEIDVPGGFFRSRTSGLERTDAVSTGLRDLTVPLDGEGTYRLGSVLPGEWEVLWVPPTGGAQEPQVVVVPAATGGAVVRNLAYDGVSVRGTVFDPQGRPAARATVEAFPGLAPVMADTQGSFRLLGMRPGRYQVRARQRHLRSDLVDVELRRPGDRVSVQLHLLEESVSDRLRIELGGATAGFCYVEADNAQGGQLVQVREGLAEVRLDPPLGELIHVACNSDGRWMLGDWQNLRQALKDGLAFDLGTSTASLALIGESSAGGITISAPGGWDLGQLRMWFGGAPTFSVGETIPNLPMGAYLVRWGDDSRTVFTERRRTTEVDLDG